MELPIVEFPTYVREMSSVFAELFKQERTRDQFMRLMTGFVMADKHTISHMNGLFIYHTNQCNLNRFVTKSPWKVEDINNMFGVSWQYDHRKDKKVYSPGMV